MPPDDESAIERKPRFLVDQNVQEAVCRFLSEHGYNVERTRDVTAPDAPDNLIAFVASYEGLILVSHDTDFKKFSQFFPIGQRDQYRRGAGQIILKVAENRAAERLRATWESIMFHYELSQRMNIRFYATVTLSTIGYTDNAPVSRTVDTRIRAAKASRKRR